MNNTEERIITLGRDLIQQVGYHAFGFKQIAAELQIKNAAIHYYFPSKDDLVLAIIKKDSADFNYLTEQMTNSSPVEKVNAVTGLYRHYFEEGRKLCMIGTCGSVFEQLSEKMQIAAKEHLRNIAAWLEDTFREGLSTGEFNFTCSPAEMSAQWLSGLPGALVTGRVLGWDHLTRSLELLKRSLKN